MPTSNPFKQSQKERARILRTQEKQIKNAYLEGYKRTKDIFKFVRNKNVESETLKRVYARVMEKEMANTFTMIDRSVERIITNNLDKMVTSVLENNQSYLSGLGYKEMINTRDMRNKAVTNILNGSIYPGKGYNLSSSIWGDNKMKQKEVEKLIAQGIMEGKNINQIAKSLEKYVNPNVVNKVKVPGVRGKIDYNALRLARTTVQHAYQKAFVDSTYYNPFIDAYKWITAGTANVCELCIERETEDQYGLGPGIFPKDQLPLDHPNGQCTFDVVTTMSNDEMTEAIANWYLGEGDPEMNRKLDLFAESLK